MRYSRNNGSLPATWWSTLRVGAAVRVVHETMGHVEKEDGEVTKVTTKAVTVSYGKKSARFSCRTGHMLNMAGGAVDRSAYIEIISNTPSELEAWVAEVTGGWFFPEDHEPTIFKGVPALKERILQILVEAYDNDVTGPIRDPNGKRYNVRISVELVPDPTVDTTDDLEEYREALQEASER